MEDIGKGDNAMRQRVVLWLLIIVLLSCLADVVSLGIAQEEQEGFNNAIEYDVYFQADDKGFSVIRNVRIKGFIDIKGITFVVVEAGAFKIKNREGFIRFDSVRAVVPRDTFQVDEDRDSYSSAKSGH
jgi:hypothetical protein